MCVCLDFSWGLILFEGHLSLTFDSQTSVDRQMDVWMMVCVRMLKDPHSQREREKKGAKNRRDRNHMSKKTKACDRKCDNEKKKYASRIHILNRFSWFFPLLRSIIERRESLVCDFLYWRLPVAIGIGVVCAFYVTMDIVDIPRIPLMSMTTHDFF